MSARDVKVGATELDEARNRLFGAGMVQDPYPVYQLLRGEGEVLPGSVPERFGVESPAEER